MHCNKHANDLNGNKINYQKIVDHKFLPKTHSKREAKSSWQPIISLETQAKQKITDLERNDVSNTETFSRPTTKTTSADSTDSGVNLSDVDDISPSSAKSSQLDSIATNSIPSHCYKKSHKYCKNVYRDNNVNNNESNDGKHVNNNNKCYTVNYNDDENKNNNSQNFTKKFKVLDSNEQGRNSISQCQQKAQICMYSMNAVNICQQKDFAKFTPFETSTAKRIDTTANDYNNKTSLPHNEFIFLRERSTASSLSMSTTRNSYDDSLPSNMHQCKRSPVVSVHSINSTIITSDSDSDINSDAENYVIKKLGPQVAYTANDPAIPNINSGCKVLNQKIIANSNQAILPPLEALAVIGGNIGAAQALGPVPSTSGAAQRPQIGSIALSNSSDVTFGDKHFYEGPVTIQQFLIDSREKSKEANGKENPTFTSGNIESSANNAKYANQVAEKNSAIYDYILKHRRLLISGILAITILLIVSTIWWSNTLPERKTQDNVGGGYVFRMVPRDGWLAQPPVNPWVKLKLPVDRVIVIPTKTSECETQASCTYTVRITQTYNIESQRQDDIIYNFLIGGDGNIYEGRGWDNRGSLIKGFNDDSISFALIGSFKKQQPSYKQLNVTKLLLEEGVRLKKLSPNYKIIGANKLDPTSVATAADALYKSFQNWPHWSEK